MPDRAAWVLAAERTGVLAVIDDQQLEVGEVAEGLEGVDDDVANDQHAELLASREWGQIGDSGTADLELA